MIDELRDRGYDIVGIAGSSMGALVGGLQAAGKLDEFAEWAKSLTQRAVLRLLDPSITAAGVLRAEKILDAVRDILGEVTIEDLPIPYTAVATDLISGKSVWLQRGPVDAAIRASIAIPGVITPHVLDGRLLADGGILDPLPMAPIAAVNADLTIAVSLSRQRGRRPYEPTDTEPQGDDRMVEPDVAQHHGAVRVQPRRPSLMRLPATRSSSTPSKEEAVPRLGSFEVMNRTIDIAQAALARHTLAAYPPDLLIEVPRTACRSLEFHRAAEVIDIGRELAAAVLDELEKPNARKADSGSEELGDLGGHPPALLPTGQRGRSAARGIERVGAERRDRLVVGEHPERRPAERVDLLGGAAAERRRCRSALTGPARRRRRSRRPEPC